MVFSENAEANTLTLQSAINAASYRADTRIDLPAGVIPINNVYCFYHETLNPGFSQASTPGLIWLKGRGQMDISAIRGAEFDRGTVLVFNKSTVSALQVATLGAGHDVSPYPAREFRIQDMTVIGNTSESVIEANACPGFRMLNTSVVQRNAEGNGVDVRSAWFGSISGSKVMFEDDPTNTDTTRESTGVGLIMGTDTAAGIFKITDACLFDGFYDNIKWVSSNKFAGLEISRCTAIQRAKHAGINITGNLYSTSIGAHFESNIQDILVSGMVDNLHMDDIFILGGTTVEAISSLPRIEITEGVATGSLSNVRYLRPWGNLLNIKGNNFGNTFDVKNIMVTHDAVANIPETIYIVKPTNTKVVVNLSAIYFTGGFSGLKATGKIQIIDTSVYKRFNYASHTTPVTTYGDVIPDWDGSPGDTHHLHSPVSHLGWICTTSGWKPYGEILTWTGEAS